MAEGPHFASTHPKAPASGWVGPEYALIVVHPPELAGQRVALAPGLILGRSPEPGTVSIFHETISRRHAGVRAGLGGVPCVFDLGSRNGTKVNGERQEGATPLAPGYVVRLGDVLAVVDHPGDADFADSSVLPGSSPRMAVAREQLARAAPEAGPVLIVGETGTGKERVAREVHDLSGRVGAYLALNCAELSPQLVESQLFGHERGAFTGASHAKTGLFAAADGGTLFLDEIGELPLELQPKLLRVLQEGEVRPLGSVQSRKLDVRIVAATNRDLAHLVARDAFRRDLLARLSLWEIRLPPLRERRQDLLAWVSKLLALANAERAAVPELQFTADAAERILLHPWLDNLRGLDRLARRLASLGSDRPLGVRALTESMPELFSGRPAEAVIEPRPSSEPAEAAPVGASSSSSSPPAESPGPAPEGDAPRRPTREELLAVYVATGQSVRATSKHFGKDRRQIYRWLELFGIPREPDGD